MAHFHPAQQQMIINQDSFFSAVSLPDTAPYSYNNMILTSLLKSHDIPAKISVALVSSIKSVIISDIRM